jgi:hypothetical protein
MYELLILDVMLQFEDERDYALLGFSDRMLSPMEAGLQILELIRNRDYTAGRGEGCLQGYESAVCVILSSSRAMSMSTGISIDSDRREGIHSVVKAFHPNKSPKAPSDEFFKQVRTAIDRARRARPLPQGQEA